MKKSFTRLSIFAIMMSAHTFTAIAQKGGKNHQNKDNKEGKHDSHDNQEKHNRSENDHGQSVVRIYKHEKHDNNRNGQKFVKWQKKQNHGNKNNNRKNESMALINNGKNDKDGYGWNDETFKERKKLRNQEKVTICHKVNNNNEPGVAISVSANAVKAHMKHGDAMGSCPEVQNSSFSNAYLTKRTDYYNSLQKSQEQVSYSQSILDYAIARLNNSRLQLTTLKANNMPAVEIQSKQATVVELEQNVSLLETLIGAATNFVVSKL